jgi:hypothetical protein
MSGPVVLPNGNGVKVRLAQEVKSNPLGVKAVFSNRQNRLEALRSEGFDRSDPVVQRLMEEVKLLKTMSKARRVTVCASVPRF